MGVMHIIHSQISCVLSMANVCVLHVTVSMCVAPLCFVPYTVFPLLILMSANSTNLLSGLQIVFECLCLIIIGFYSVSTRVVFAT